MPSVVIMLRICEMVHLSIYAFFYCITLFNKYMQVLGKINNESKKAENFMMALFLGKNTSCV